MKRLDFLKSVGLSAAGLTLGLYGGASATATPERPNVLFLFADDQRFNAVNALNNPQVMTPAMDSLVQEGTTFTHAHIMGATNGAVCMPSRAMVMTGRHLFHLKNSGAVIPPTDVTMPERFGTEGYVTFGTGKWHNGRPAFTRSFSQGANIFFGGMSNHLKVPVFDFDPSGKYPPKNQRVGEKFSTELFSDSAIKFLQEYKDEKPFFAYVAFTAPHDPRMAPKEFADLYPPDKIDIPENFMPVHPFDNGEMRIRDEMLAPFPRTPEVVREHLAAYYAMITHLDHHIGRILKTLEETGKLDNTIIVFAADNGLAVGSHGLMGKQNLYDHSLRVPLVFKGPSIPGGVKNDVLCYLHDVFPTLCDLTGVEIPPTVESRSLALLLKGTIKRDRDSLYFSYKTEQRAVKSADGWKLIKYNVKGKDTTQLFHVATDPWEMKNLADDASHSDRLKAMTDLLKDWMKKSDDPCDLDKPKWGKG